MNYMRQRKLEALYSRRNIHTVLHHAIRYQLDKLFLNWTLAAFIKIPQWIAGKYYESKNIRLQELNKHIAKEGLESLVVAIAASTLHTHRVQTIQQTVGYLQAFLPHSNPFDRAKTAGELLALCSRADSLYEIERHGSGIAATVKINFWELIDQRLLDQFEWINDTHFNLPMVAPPKRVSDNHHCGYLSLKVPLLLGSLTQHDAPQNYKTINQLNSIEWIMDQDVLAEPERPTKPFESIQEQENYIQMVTESDFVYDVLRKDPFWLCWQYDSRGRIYSHGYHVNFQAAEYKKACLSFNKFETVTE